MPDNAVDGLRDQFWGQLQILKYQEVYMEQYLLCLSRILLGIDVFTALFAAGGIYSWWTWSQGRWAWTIFIALSQIGQIVKPFLPYAKRTTCLRFFLPELKQINVDLGTDWNRLECSPSEAGYRQAIKKYEQRFTTLDCKYLGGEPLPESKRVVKRSWEIWCRFFKNRYNVEGRRYDDGKQPQVTTANKA